MKLDTMSKSIFKFDFINDNLTNNIQPIVALTAITLTSGVTYFYYKNKHRYWKNRGVNGPEPQILTGTTNYTLTNPKIYLEWVKKYGRVFGVYSGYIPVLVVGDPEILKDILIRNFHMFSDRRVVSGNPETNNLINQNGGQWKHDRAVLSPTFSTGKMKLMYPLMKESFECFDRELERLSSAGVDVDIKNVFAKLTTMVIARCAFATHVDAFTDEKNELLEHLANFFVINKFRVFLRVLLPKFVIKLTGLSLTFPKSNAYVYNVCKEILKQRKETSGNEYTDLLQLLMDTNKDTKDGFSDLKIISNAILFFIAGYETTSTLLTWTSYALVMNPHVQETLYQELKQAYDENGNFNYDVLFELKYLDAVMNETLRMYPPVPTVERVATDDYILPNGIKIEKGNPIRVPVYLIQHDPDNYPEPELFKPERFLPENKDQLKPCTFLPFVAGPRNCIGMRFAQLEAKMTLAETLIKYKFVKCSRTPEKVEFSKNSFILSLDEYFIKIEKRQ